MAYQWNSTFPVETTTPAASDPGVIVRVLGGITTTPSASSGVITTTSRILSAAASTNATSAKASAGTLYRVTGHNANVAARYLKFYNKASSPTVGTDTPVLTFYLPAQTAFVFDWAGGRLFSTGIAYALTTGVADADTGALTAADILGLMVEYT